MEPCEPVSGLQGVRGGGATVCVLAATASIRVNRLATGSDRDEQSCPADIAQGVVKTYRHATSHDSACGRSVTREDFPGPASRVIGHLPQTRTWPGRESNRRMFPPFCSQATRPLACRVRCGDNRKFRAVRQWCCAFPLGRSRAQQDSQGPIMSRNALSPSVLLAMHIQAQPGCTRCSWVPACRRALESQPGGVSSPNSSAGLPRRQTR